jgi:hypothetical protein
VVMSTPRKTDSRSRRIVFSARRAVQRRLRRRRPGTPGP